MHCTTFGSSGMSLGVVANNLVTSTALVKDKAAIKETIQPATPADSGYATAGSLSQSTSARSNNTSGSGFSSIFKVRQQPKPLEEFDIPIPPGYCEQYARIVPQLQHALLHRLKKSGQSCLPITMRLMVLGSSQADAKPWIVIFCKEDKKKRIKKFTKETFVKDLCDRSFEGSCKFDIMVYERGVMMLSGSALHIEAEMHESLDNLSGISIRCKENMRLGILGGLIELERAGQTVTYGLVARHLLQVNDGDGPDSTIPSVDSSSSDEDSLDDETPTGSPPTLNRGSAEVPGTSHEAWHHPLAFGKPEVGSNMSTVGFRSLGTIETRWGSDCGRMYDWKLMKLDPDVNSEPNRLQMKRSLLLDSESHLHAMTKMELQKAHRGVANVREPPILAGSFSHTPASICTDLEYGFVDAIPLAPDKNGKFNKPYGYTES
jgi:hypothetical protein